MANIISKIRYLIELSKELPFYFIVRINGYFDKEAYFYDCFSYLLMYEKFIQSYSESPEYIF